MSGQGIHPLAAVIISIVVCTLLGIAVEKIAYKPLRRATPLAVLITAIGVSYFLQNAALLLFGADTKSFSSVVTLPALKLADGALTISGTTIVTIAACIVIMVALMLFIKKTKAGQAMLAVSEDKDAAQLMGVNDQRDDFLNVCHRFGTGCDCRSTVLFRLSDADAVHRFYAGYQGVYRSGIRRNRLDPGSAHRRNPAWNH